MNPEISVVLSTAQGNNPMLGFPDMDMFTYTISALQRQTFRKFELVVTDYLHATRKYDWRRIGRVGFPIYHVPLTHSLAHKMGYCAMCGTRNNGIMHSSADFLIFIDDCSNFEARYIEKIYYQWQMLRTFPNALFMIDMGTQPFKDKNGNLINDDRFKIMEDKKRDLLINETNMYSFSSMTMEAALNVNGFDEAIDFGRQLDDIDMGQRLMKAGYSISVHKNIVAKEQRHIRIPHTDEDIPEFHFRQHLKCAAPAIFMKLERRTGDDYIRANGRQFTDEEKLILNEKPCHFSYMNDGVLNCKGSRLPCDWVTKEKTHMKMPEAEIWLNSIPVFDLAEERKIRLKDKEKYRVA